VHPAEHHGKQHPRAIIAINNNRIVGGQPPNESTDLLSQVGRRFSHRQKTLRVIGKQVYIPGQGQAELRINAGMKADVGQEQNIEFHEASPSEPLVQGGVVLDWMIGENAKARPHPIIMAGRRDPGGVSYLFTGSMQLNQRKLAAKTYQHRHNGIMTQCRRQ
jgi:hypothetical protein